MTLRRSAGPQEPSFPSVLGSTRSCAEKGRVRHRHPAECSGLFVATFVLGLAASASAAEVDARDLLDLSLEELADIQVTSVSKRPESLAKAPASVFVITGEDVRRAGATSLPEALRLAPNLLVARSHATGYSIKIGRAHV